MKLFGSDFFLWLRFAYALIKLIGEIFGDDEDKKNVKENHIID